MLKKSQNQEGKRASLSAADQNSSTPKNPQLFTPPSVSSASASGDDDEQSAEDDDELSSSVSQGVAPVLKFDCRQTGKRVKSPSCSDPGSQDAEKSKPCKLRSRSAKKQCPTHVKEDITIIKEIEPGFSEDISRSEVVDNPTKHAESDIDSLRIEPQNLDPDNNEVAHASSNSKRSRGEKDTSANTDLTLINSGSHISVKNAKCVSKGMLTSAVVIAGSKPKSRSPANQKHGTGVALTKKRNRNFNQQINMVSKGSTKSINVNMSSGKTKGKTTGNQTQVRPLRSHAAQANTSTPGDSLTKTLSKIPLGKSFSRNKAQSNVAADSESNVLSSRKASERNYNLKLDSKALVKGGTTTLKDKWRKQTLHVRPVDSDDEWLGLGRQKAGPQHRKSSAGNGKVAFNSNDMIMTKIKGPASVRPPMLSAKSKTVTIVKMKKIESVRKGLKNSNNENSLNTTTNDELPGRPTTHLKGTYKSGQNQSVRKTSPSRVATSANSKSRHSNSVAGTRQSKVSSIERPKSANDAMVFLREKILAQENDRRKSKFLLDNRNRGRHFSRIEGGTSSNDGRSRSSRNKSMKTFRRVRRRSRSMSPNGPSIATEFSKFNFLKVPIIWSFGLTHISINKNVQEVLETIKRRNAFHEINLDLEILKWKTTPGFVKYSESVLEPSNFHDAIVFRASKILRKGSSLGMDSEKVPLTASEICQLLKLAILTAQVNINPRGYILKNFPTSTEEGIEFELLFYPSTAGLYFLNNHWSKSRALPPDVYQMNNFSRIHGYSEYEVEKAADHFGSKTIKVSNAEDLHGKRVHDVVFLLQFHINGDSEALKALAEKNRRINAALRRSKRSKASNVINGSREEYEKLVLSSKKMETIHGYDI
ncbi:unnamed protein product [Allacma fusca]|uniref:Uncharacterized protein n=1 Tax=Allacma fusca TaxID=39272 RepID=A0A8J2L5C3_9HEXA|nr:unnamed protein product [Allacma fusca]